MTKLFILLLICIAKKLKNKVLETQLNNTKS